MLKSLNVFLKKKKSSDMLTTDIVKMLKWICFGSLTPAEGWPPNCTTTKALHLTAKKTP